MKPKHFLIGLAVLVFLFLVATIAFAQEKKLTPEQEKIQKEFTEWNTKLDKIDSQLAKVMLDMETLQKQKDNLLAKRNEITVEMNKLNQKYNETLQPKKE